MSDSNIVILTGAGISADSGVDTFRTKGGLWAQYDYREVATPEGFAANPQLVHEFYNMRRRALPKVAPNAAHSALAKLEAAMSAKGGQLTLITQNVDDLHERAGQRQVLHMHGELFKIRCTLCGSVMDWRDDLSLQTPCPNCAEATGLRPDVVWFGEMPRFLEEAEDAIAAADLFVAIGTSGNVYPAAGFVDLARHCGVKSLLINLEPSDNARAFDDHLLGAAAQTVPDWVSRLLA